jgi:hypothetical protein
MRNIFFRKPSNEGQDEVSQDRDVSKTQGRSPTSMAIDFLRYL